MATPAAKAQAGYYATPTGIPSAVAKLIRIIGRRRQPVVISDFCAADGAAVIEFAAALRGERGEPLPTAIYAVELERGRAEQLAENLASHHGEGYSLHADALSLSCLTDRQRQGVDATWCNPPYDTDKQYGRLEHRWLRYITPTIRPEGLLAFVVPYYALTSCAETLAREYEADLRCVRFPDPEWAAYKQVALIARRRSSPLPDGWEDQEVVRLVQSWASRTELLPILPSPDAEPGERIQLALAEGGGFASWQVKRPDTVRFALGMRRGGAPLSDWGLGRLEDMFRVRINTAMPPGYVHIAAALASSFLNGVRVAPNSGAEGATGLVKARFTIVEERIAERLDSKGNLLSETKVQKPRLSVHFLDMGSGKLSELKSNTHATGAAEGDEMTVGDLVEGYSDSLLDAMRRRAPALHDPANPQHLLTMPPTARPPYPPQAHAIIAMTKMLILYRLGRAPRPILSGQVGTGKSITAIITAYLLSPQHIQDTVREVCRQYQIAARVNMKPVRVALVVCPPHLGHSWQKEIKKTLPRARVVRIKSMADLTALAAWKSQEVARAGQVAAGVLPRSDAGIGGEMTFAILGREGAKLGSERRAALLKLRGRRLCPTCLAELPMNDDGNEVSDAEVVAKKLRCGHDQEQPSGILGQVASELRLMLAAALPHDPLVRHNLPRIAQRSAELTKRPRYTPDDASTSAAVQEAVWRSRANGTYQVSIYNPHYGMRYEPHPLPPIFERNRQLAACSNGRSYNGAWGWQGSEPQKQQVAAQWGQVAHSEAPDPQHTPLGSLIMKLTDTAARLTSLGHVNQILQTASAAIVGLCFAMPHPGREAFAAQLARRLYAVGGQADNQAARLLRDTARQLALTIKPGSSLQEALVGELRQTASDETEWAAFDQARERLLGESETSTAFRLEAAAANDELHPAPTGYAALWYTAGEQTLGSHHAGEAAGAVSVLFALSQTATGRLQSCNAPLYQVTASPRRYPLATLITRKYPHLVDMVIADEAQEYAHWGTAQTTALARLLESTPLATALSGSLMNGYAQSLLAPFWMMNPPGFRREFGVADDGAFNQEYGYLKIRYSQKDEDDAGEEGDQDTEYGAVSDRQLNPHRAIVGVEPGLKPGFYADWLLPATVPIYIDDLDLNIPPMRHIAAPIIPAADDEWGNRLLRYYHELEDRLLNLIERDKGNDELKGKLRFALATLLPTYLDRATQDTGRGTRNGETRFIIRYPKRVGGMVAADMPTIPADVLTPKEQALLQVLKTERDQGRPSLVFVASSGKKTALVARLERILRKAGLLTAVLDAGAVPPEEREQWLDTQVIARRVDVLIANPHTVKTGLNNLVYFKNCLWYDCPRCDAICYVQGCGRARRNGQDAETHSYTFYYADTVQEDMQYLWMKKVAEVQKTGGVDWTALLEGVGVGGSGHGEEEVALGEMLYRKMLQRHGQAAAANAGFADYQTRAAKQPAALNVEVLRVGDLVPPSQISDTKPERSGNPLIIFGSAPAKAALAGNTKKRASSGESQMPLF